jgi:RNA polymerase sigma-70 factor, ECF subfamily
MDQNLQHEQFLRLFMQVQPQIYSYLRTVIFNRTDADDVFQNVACILWQKFDQFQPGTRFDHWACSIAYHQAMAHIQKGRRDRLVFGADVLALIADKAASENQTFSTFQDALPECLEKLPEQDKQVIRLRFEPLATNRSVAAALGRSETAVSRVLSRIYATLLNCIRDRTEAREQGGGA